MRTSRVGLASIAIRFEVFLEPDRYGTRRRVWRASRASRALRLRQYRQFQFRNIVIEPIIAVQVGVAVGGNASVTQLLGQLNFSSIVSDALGHLPGSQTLSAALPLLGHARGETSH